MTSAPSWLNAGDNAWQLTAATLVGIMSIPGLAILYGGIVKRRWAVNSALMVVYAFAMTLVVWTLFAYNMAFGKQWFPGHGHVSDLIGKPASVLGAGSLLGQAHIPLLDGLIPDLHFPGSTLVYFQFVFAAITVIILAGAVLGRMSFKAWMLFAPLWITCVYTVGAFMIWGGGWLSQLGALDFSGGYVIHVAAAASGFTAAAVIGPRLARDRTSFKPNNMMMALAGGGLLWLGWSGFNGGDPYFANANAAAAVLNTHVCTAVALLTWMAWDVIRTGKANTTGMINGMIAGLVAITPGAGWISGYSAAILGVAAGTVPYFTMNVLGNRGIFKKVDDTLGVIHTHGFPGALGGLFVGIAATPNMIQYLGTKGNPDVSFAGWIHGNPHQFVVQAFTLGVIVVFNVVATFVILKVISFITPLRMSQAELEGADVAVHGEYVIDLEGLELPEAVPALAGVAADGDGRGGPIAAQLRATLGEALGVHPDGLALLSGEQAAAALAKHAALEARLRSQSNPTSTTGTIPGKPANRATKVRPSSEDAE
ncbi:MAG TPA: ammonium transporter [Candidatus Dormibacteraeota bacterium]